MYAAPLQLQPGRWYEVGATEYGGPGDPTSGGYGSIPDPGAVLPARAPRHLRRAVGPRPQPGEQRGFTFADANALDHLPYLTALRVSHDGPQALLQSATSATARAPASSSKTGSPTGWTCGGRPPGRSASARAPVQVAARARRRARRRRSKRSRAQAKPPPANRHGSACAARKAAASIPLPLTPGTQTKILPSGLAAAGEEAPAAVKAMVAAGNRLYGTSLPLRRRRTAARWTRCSRRMTAPRRCPTCCTGAACSARAPWTPPALRLRRARPRPLRLDLRQRRARLHLRRRAALRHRRRPRV